MFIADFLKGPGTDKTPFIVGISFYEYILGKVNANYMLERVGARLNLDLINNYYYKGVRICY
tara:strand:+ start:984 stop:1169 length:186 start_codon:yes stop_codon:yes gene_type:complete